MQYKINQPIYVRYLELEKAEGLIDLLLTPTNPSGVDQTPITFTDLGDGLYQAPFTPNATGWWQVRVSCVSKPGNIYSKTYFVGTEYDKYPSQEDGKLTSIDTKIGEVQATPTINSLLGRLKDLWDKLHDIFITGNGKVKIHDGTFQANVDADKFLFAKGYGTPIFQEDFRYNLLNAAKWSEIKTGSASKVISNQILQLKVTQANGDSIRECAEDGNPFIVLIPRTFQCQLFYGTHQVNNRKDWGVCSSDDLDCYEFSLVDGVLKFITAKGGVDTEYDLSAYQPPINEYHRYKIQFTGRHGVYVFIDNVLVLNLSSFTTLLTNNKLLYPSFANYNINALSNPTGDLAIAAVVLLDESNSQKILLGIDSNGLSRQVSVTQEGRLEVSLIPTLGNITVQLLHDKLHSAVNAGEWQEILEYQVPNGYNLNVIAFEAQSQFSNEAARAIYKNIMGTFTCSTNTFTNGTSITLPRFTTRLYAVTTVAIGSGVNDTFTITYTNEQGVTGRTGTVTFPKNSLVGTRLEVTLQTGDEGIIDITDITHSATGQAGVVQFAGYIELLYLTLTNTNTQYQSASIALGGLIVLEGEIIYLQYLSGTKTTYIRRLNLLTALVPK